MKSLNVLPVIASIMTITSMPVFAQDGEAEPFVTGGELSVARWSYDLLGNVTNDDERLTFDDGVQSEDNDQLLARIAVGFGSHWLPELSLEATKLVGQVDGQFETRDATGLFTASGTGNSNADFDDLSLGLHWPLTTSGILVSGGLIVEQVDGTITTTNDGDSTVVSDDYDQIFPIPSLQLSLAAEGGFEMRIEGGYIRSGDDRAARFAARVLWPIIKPLGFELGYLNKRYAFETDNQDVSATFRGGYFGLLAVF